MRHSRLPVPLLLRLGILPRSRSGLLNLRSISCSPSRSRYLFADGSLVLLLLRKTASLLPAVFRRSRRFLDPRPDKRCFGFLPSSSFLPDSCASPPLTTAPLLLRLVALLLVLRPVVPLHPRRRRPRPDTRSSRCLLSDTRSSRCLLPEQTSCAPRVVFVWPRAVLLGGVLVGVRLCSKRVPNRERAQQGALRNPAHFPLLLPSHPPATAQAPEKLAVVPGEEVQKRRQRRLRRLLVSPKNIVEVVLGELRCAGSRGVSPAGKRCRWAVYRVFREDKILEILRRDFGIQEGRRVMRNPSVAVPVLRGGLLLLRHSEPQLHLGQLA